MHAEILAVGDEVVSGQILDTNTQWLSQRLGELGIRVLFHSTVGDDLDALGEVFRRAIARADLVIATGGLGPTTDDLTREGLAEAIGRRLVLDDDAMRHVREIFARRKREMPQRNERQAYLPEGSRMVRNPNGTAPGIEVDVPRSGKSSCRVVALPGVPAEMKEMWHDSVAAGLRGLGAGERIIRYKLIKCFGAGESHIEAMLPDGFLREHQPPIGITASQTSIVLRIPAVGASLEECDAAIEPAVALIRSRLGKLVFGEDEDELETVVVRLLRRQQKTLALAEWGTGGLVADWLSVVAGADGPFLGGLVLANADALAGLLGPEEEALSKHPAGSREAAESLAVACRQRFSADYGLAVGRFPPFDPAAAEPNPVFFALATPSGVRTREVAFAGHPAILRVYCAKQALNLVRLMLLESTA